jgi:hypothetical protein
VLRQIAAADARSERFLCCLRFDDDVALAFGALRAALANTGIATGDDAEDESAERLDWVVRRVEVCRLILKRLDGVVRVCYPSGNRRRDMALELITPRCVRLVDMNLVLPDEAQILETTCLKESVWILAVDSVSTRQDLIHVARWVRLFDPAANAGNRVA